MDELTSRAEQLAQQVQQRANISYEAALQVVQQRVLAARAGVPPSNQAQAEAAAVVARAQALQHHTQLQSDASAAAQSPGQSSQPLPTPVQ